MIAFLVCSVAMSTKAVEAAVETETGGTLLDVDEAPRFLEAVLRWWMGGRAVNETGWDHAEK